MSEHLVDRYRRWFEYEKDVHKQVLDSLQLVRPELQQTDGFKKAVELFAHILAARSMWLYRFEVSAEPAELFPKSVELGTLSRLMEHTHAIWSDYLKGLNDGELARVFEYQSYEGKRFRGSIEDILTQLFGHSWYHRGQIAMLLRSIGAEPAVTDFVFWSREPVSN